MFRGHHQLTRLAKRKELLIAESGLNRALLIREAAALSTSVRKVSLRFCSVGSIASSVAVLLSSLLALKPSRSAPSEIRPSRLRSLIQHAGIISTHWFTHWLSHRSRHRTHADRVPRRKSPSEA